MIELRHKQTAGRLHLQFSGIWEWLAATAMREALHAIRPNAGEVIVVDTSQVQRLDITAAWLIYQQTQHWQQQGYEVQFEQFPEEYRAYFAQPRSALLPSNRWQALAHPFVRAGKRIAAQRQAMRSFLGFFGHCLVSVGRSLLYWPNLRVRSVFHHVFATGISAVPVVALIACLISIVITYQGGGQLRDLGAEIYTVDMVAISVLRELGVLLTAIMVAGRSGSAFAAEIGLMQTNQEVDALQVMGVDPFTVLVVPRLLALVIALPLLTLLADMVALLAAALISVPILDISVSQFFARVASNISLQTFAAGLIKAPFFAVVIAMIGCWQGMRVTGSSESLGQHTTKAVVDAIFVVLLLDALFSILFYQLGF